MIHWMDQGFNRIAPPHEDDKHERLLRKILRRTGVDTDLDPVTLCHRVAAALGADVVYGDNWDGTLKGLFIPRANDDRLHRIAIRAGMDLCETVITFGHEFGHLLLWESDPATRGRRTRHVGKAAEAECDKLGEALARVLLDA